MSAQFHKHVGHEVGDLVRESKDTSAQSNNPGMAPFQLLDVRRVSNSTTTTLGYASVSQSLEFTLEYNTIITKFLYGTSRAYGILKMTIPFSIKICLSITYSNVNDKLRQEKDSLHNCK